MDYEPESEVTEDRDEDEHDDEDQNEDEDEDEDEDEGHFGSFPRDGLLNFRMRLILDRTI